MKGKRFSEEHLISQMFNTWPSQASMHVRGHRSKRIVARATAKTALSALTPPFCSQFPELSCGRLEQT